METLTGLNVVAIFDAEQICNELGAHFSKNPLPSFLGDVSLSVEEQWTVVTKYMQDVVELALSNQIEDIPEPSNLISWLSDTLKINDYDASIFKDFITDSGYMNPIIATAQKLATNHPWAVLKLVTASTGDIMVVSEGDFRVIQWMSEHEVDGKYYHELPTNGEA